MPPKIRPNSISVRLSDDEVAFRELLEEQLGTDGASVMRMGLLDLGRARGFEFPISKEKRGTEQRHKK
jgi:hypothetical protein